MMSINVVKSSLFVAVIAGVIYLIHQMNLEKKDPKHVYGEWVEIESASHSNETLTVSEVGVYRNGRFISGAVNFNGNDLIIESYDEKEVFNLERSFHSELVRTNIKNAPLKFVKSLELSNQAELLGGRA